MLLENRNSSCLAIHKRAGIVCGQALETFVHVEKVVISLVLGNLAAGPRKFEYPLFAALEALTFLALNHFCKTEQRKGSLLEAL